MRGRKGLLLEEHAVKGRPLVDLDIQRQMANTEGGKGARGP